MAFSFFFAPLERSSFVFCQFFDADFLLLLSTFCFVFFFFVRLGLARFGSVWFGLVRFGLVWFCLFVCFVRMILLCLVLSCFVYCVFFFFPLSPRTLGGRPRTMFAAASATANDSEVLSSLSPPQSVVVISYLVHTSVDEKYFAEQFFFHFFFSWPSKLSWKHFSLTTFFLPKICYSRGKNPASMFRGKTISLKAIAPVARSK